MIISKDKYKEVCHMSVSGVSSTTSSYANYNTTSAKSKEAEAATEKSQDKAVVYERSSNITKMSDSQRASLVKQLQADQEARKSQFTSLVMDMMNQQGGTYAKSLGKNDDSIWKFMASGNFTVDAKTKAEAQSAISEDGYWGVKQTSQRIFDFALALSGGDDDKMDEMLAAFEKGFKLATKAWGSTLPDISQQTYDAVQDLFRNYKTPSDVAEGK